MNYLCEITKNYFFKVLVLSRINSVQYASMKPTVKDTPFPKVNPDPYVSNVYR